MAARDGEQVEAGEWKSVNLEAQNCIYIKIDNFSNYPILLYLFSYPLP